MSKRIDRFLTAPETFVAPAPIGHRRVPLSLAHYMLIAHFAKWNDEYFHRLNHAYGLIIGVNHY